MTPTRILVHDCRDGRPRQMVSWAMEPRSTDQSQAEALSVREWRAFSLVMALPLKCWRSVDDTEESPDSVLSNDKSPRRGIALPARILNSNVSQPFWESSKEGPPSP